MTTKITCDRCGDSLPSNVAFGPTADWAEVRMELHWVSYEASGSNRVDLCFKCKQDIFELAFAKGLDDE